MKKFAIKIISYGVASNTICRQDETISVSSYPAVFFTESICDFNILIIWLGNINTYPNVTAISAEELNEFFNKPSVIVCFSDKESIYSEKPWVPVQWSVEPKKVRNYDWLPHGKDLVVVNKAGHQIKPTVNAGRFASLFDTYDWVWKCRFKSIPLNYKPIACNISGQTVALKADIGEGRIFIIPTPDINISTYDTYPTFLRLLIDICREEVQELEERERKEPDWLPHCIDPLEIELFGHVKTAYERYDTVRMANKLFYETGTRLTQIVQFVTSKMGFNAELKEEKGIHDIEICEDDFNILIEVTSSEEDWINNRKTRQLLDWCQRFEREKGKKPKGTLIANHFCNYSPPERDTPFTRDALKQGEDEGFCLMTTVDLYKIFCKFLKGEINKEEIKNKFLDTNGLLKFAG